MKTVSFKLTVVVYQCDSLYIRTVRTNCLGISVRQYTLNKCNSKLFDVLLGEYGNKVSNSAFYEGYLNEYGTKIIENVAIETINSYFKSTC